MRFRRAALPLAVEMDMAPLIDIVFLQLIFFMLTSAFVFQPGIKIQLPKAVTADVADQENIVITISEKNLLYLGSRLVTPQELKSRLAAKQKGGSPLLIRADRKASVGRVMEVWDLCRALGISQVHIATQTEREESR